VKVGSGPAAVTPIRLLDENLFSLDATFRPKPDGKAAEKAGEPEDLP